MYLTQPMHQAHFRGFILFNQSAAKLMKNYTPRFASILLAMAFPLAMWGQEPQVPESVLPAATEALSVAPDTHLADIQITASQKTIHVKNAQGEMLEVFNVTGVRVAAVRIDSSEKSVTLNVDKGIYIVRVGNVTRKVKLS